MRATKNPEATMGLNRCATRAVTVDVPQLSTVRLGFHFLPVAALLALAALISTTKISRADENGVSFWIPGFFGSLAATPQQPGWSVASIFYNTNVSGSGNIALSREISIGQFNPAVNASVSANVHANVDLGMVIPTYVFATPFLGGQASVSLIAAYGANDTHLNGTLAGAVGPIPFMKTIDLQQTTSGVGDLIPQFAVRWNAGVNNYMAYLTGDIPVGDYNSTNLANIGHRRHRRFPNGPIRAAC
jgi:hypothetical protein